MRPTTVCCTLSLTLHVVGHGSTVRMLYWYLDGEKLVHQHAQFLLVEYGLFHKLIRVPQHALVLLHVQPLKRLVLL